jgi:hypothetical protein
MDYAFTLPVGFDDATGHRHRDGVMRTAYAHDEIAPLADPAVRDNEAVYGLLLLARVVRRIGGVTSVTPDVIAGLYSADFAYLQALYRQVNASPVPALARRLPDLIETACPDCGARLELDPNFDLTAEEAAP